MKRTRIKFCGFTRADDLDEAVELGVDAIGLIAVPSSRRRVGLEQAVALRERIPPLVSTVLLLMDPEEAEARRWIAAVQPDLVQFHGRESPTFCRSLAHSFIKALPGSNAALLLRSATDWHGARAILLDAHEPGAPGGTGQVFDWNAIPAVLRPRCILSGGLTPENVGRAIATVAPYAVDVASGIEAAPGVKAADRMRAFVDAVRRQDQRNGQLD